MELAMKHKQSSTTVTLSLSLKYIYYWGDWPASLSSPAVPSCPQSLQGRKEGSSLLTTRPLQHVDEDPSCCMCRTVSISPSLRAQITTG
ncbi:hypothetical protein MHYP_G00062750 [Metynnis hypsauchen]